MNKYEKSLYRTLKDELEEVTETTVMFGKIVGDDKNKVCINEIKIKLEEIETILKKMNV